MAKRKVARPRKPVFSPKDKKSIHLQFEELQKRTDHLAQMGEGLMRKVRTLRERVKHAGNGCGM